MLQRNCDAVEVTRESEDLFSEQYHIDKERT